MGTAEQGRPSGPPAGFSGGLSSGAAAPPAKGGEIGQSTLRGVLPSGTSLRGYELQSILGQGAFGITYRARDLTLGRDVAVKEYLPTSLALREGRTTVVPRSPEHAEQFAWGRERFLEEGRTLARLDRATSIVRVYDFLEGNGTAYMVMALIEGETLARRLTREQRLSAEAIERIMFPLLDGLEEVHAIGFLHRDIKPANIMLDADGRPTLIDFGASRQAMAERSATLTAIFTPGYAAAEQFTSAKPGPWTDIYGLAATLCHAITGQIPPTAIDRVLQDQHEPLTGQMPEGFAPEVLAGIDAGMAVRAAERPQSIAEWRQMLRGNSQDATRIVRRPGRLLRAASRTGRARLTLRGPALWGAAAAAIMLLGAGSYFAFVAERPGALATLTAEQLERALAERRKADVLVAEKQQLEAEARRFADAEAAAKQQADAELERAREARRKAETELARLRAEAEARRQTDTGQRGQEEALARRAAEEEAQRKAEDEAEILRQAEEQAKTKVAAEAEAKRLADEALARAEAERQQAEAQAQARAEEEAAKRAADEAVRLKAEADAAKRKGDAEARQKAEAELARSKAEEEERLKAEVAARGKAETEAAQKKTAEAGEGASRLEPADRQRLQVALTALGFDTRGNDGLFGPRTRQMIADWQKARTLPVSGFLEAAHQQALLKEATPAVAKFDEERKKVEEEKRIADGAVARARVPPVRPEAASGPTAFDGRYRGETDRMASQGPRGFLQLTVVNGRGTGTLTAAACPDSPLSLTISSSGSVSGEGVLNCILPGPSGFTGPVKIEGNFDQVRSSIHLHTDRGSVIRVTLERDGTAPARPAPSDTITRAFDGTYNARLGSAGGTASASWGEVLLTVVNGRGTGTVTAEGCPPSPLSFTVAPSGWGTGDGVLHCIYAAGTTFASGAVRIGIDFTKPTPQVSFTAERGFGGSGFFLFGLQRGAQAPRPAAAVTTAFDGNYHVATWAGTGLTAGSSSALLELAVVNGQGNGKLTAAACPDSPIAVTISSLGAASGEGVFNCALSTSGINTLGPMKLEGNFAQEPPALNLYTARGGVIRLALQRGVAATSAPASVFDGTYAGELTYVPGGSGNVVVAVRIVVANGHGVGTIITQGCSSTPFPVAISSAGDVSGIAQVHCQTGRLMGDLNLYGKIVGNAMRLNYDSPRGGGTTIWNSVDLTKN